MDSKLKYVTTCRVDIGNGAPCGQQFQDTPLDVPIIGEPPSAKTQRFVEALGKHLHRRHEQHAAVITNLGMQFSGYLITKSFTTQDPGLMQVQEGLRVHLFQMARRFYITDDQIRDTVARLGFTAEDGGPVVSAMIEMRDILTETTSKTSNPALSPLSAA